MVKSKHTYMMIKLFVYGLFIVSFLPSSVYAQNGNDMNERSFETPRTIQFSEESFMAAPSKPEMAVEDVVVFDEPEATVIEDVHGSQYINASIQNLSKLYWKKNTLDINNDEAIKNFLIINECSLYEEFYKDDFEWKRIHDAARAMLKENKESFSDKFKILLPVNLGRYDIEKKGFPISESTSFTDLRRIELGSGYQGEICGIRRDIKYYPRNIVLSLSRPFDFNFIPLDEHIAQAFIIKRKYDNSSVNYLKNSIKDYDRPVFTRLRISLTSYQGQTKGTNNSTLAVMFGKIDGIDIFEDPYEKNLLTSVNFTN